MNAGRAATALAALFACGCLDPLVSDEPGLSGFILPAGSPVPSAHDDPAIERQIRLNDGVEGLVPQINAFAEGAPVTTWDFGPAPSFAAPLFRLVRREGNGLVAVNHPPVIEALPGEEGYSPFWAGLLVVVTDAYEDQLLTSLDAVQEAVDLGLVEAPFQVSEAVNCPVVARDVTLEDEGNEVAPLSQFYWEGMTVDYYDFGRLMIEEEVNVPIADRYVLHRVGNEPANEVLLNVDITGDDDRDDTNDILTGRQGEGGYSPLCRTVEVAVRANANTLDNLGPGEEPIADAADLFPDDVPNDLVVGYRETDDLRNCPQELAEPQP
jgi:hypothetical protein